MRITLLTDFGNRDGFVGAMKGIIASRAPNCQVIDLAHDVPAGDLRHASHVLFTTAPFFPAGTVHVVVVDPGVGTARRAVAVAVDDQMYIAPDNGVLTDVLQSAAGRVVATQITNAAFWQHPVSTTFHGRDIFAPVAAHIASGVPITALGSSINPDTLLRLEPLLAQVDDGRALGCVAYIDIFGNAVTSLSRQHLARLGVGPEALLVTVGDGLEVEIKQTYGSVAEGQPVAVIGSWGRLEIAVNGRSAAELLGLSFGQGVEVRPK